MEKKVKHLEFLQGIVNRLATDSFRMKGWSVVLVSALFVLLVREEQMELALVGLIPILVFWGLDGYFLWQERLFRRLYDSVRVLGEDKIDFSMDVGKLKRDRKSTWIHAMFSRTLMPFYGVLTCLVVLTIVVI